MNIGIGNMLLSFILVLGLFEIFRLIYKEFIRLCSNKLHYRSIKSITGFISLCIVIITILILIYNYFKL